MKIVSYRLITIFYFLFFSNYFVFPEGTKQIRPNSTDYGALYIGGGSIFATPGCGVKYRININISNAGETILFGFHGPTNTSANFTLRKPDGTQVANGTVPSTTGQTGYIPDWTTAVAGPFPASGGYTPLTYQVSNPLELGDYFIDFSGFSGSLRMNEFDIQVVTGANSPALTGDAINGRVWSGAWQFYADLNSNETFSGKLFVYSDDGIVTSCKYGNSRVGQFSMYCNQYGCLNTGNFVSDRKSKDQNTSLSFSGIAQYKIFLNNPDILPYPDGVYGTMTGTPTIIPDPAFPPCSGEKMIVVNVNKAGNVEILIDVPYGDVTYDVPLYANVVAGTNNIPWNGKDGLGTPVPDGTHLGITVTYVNGLTNLPIWDQEQNPNGYIVTLERPMNPSGSNPKTYWDDTNLTLISGTNNCPVFPIGSNLPGCSPTTVGCHIWSGTDCHNKMINTWWYSASSSTANIDTYHTGTPPLPSALPQWGCGPGIVHLSATVLAQEDVRWWDQQTGGTLLWTCTPFNVNLPAVGVYHFWAEAFNPASTCTSTDRLDVVAEAVQIPSPPAPMGGPFYTCGPGTVTLVTTNTNPDIRIDWYDNATPPNKIWWGNSFTTPVITTTTTYYTEAVEIGSPAGCVSATRTPFVAEVRVSPTVTNTTTSQTICSGGSPTIVLTSNPSGATFSWTASNPDGNVVGYTAFGSGDLPTEILNINPGAFQPGVVNYSVIPTYQLCPGNPLPFTITVNPIANVALNSTEQTKCSGSLTDAVPLGTSVVGATVGYSWTVACDPGIVTCPAGGSANILPVTTIDLNGTTFVQQVATYTITPAIGVCSGTPAVYRTRINPIPDLTLLPASHTAICSGATTNFSISSQVSNPAFQWSATGGSNITPGSLTNQTDNPVQRNFANSGNTIQQVNFSITASASGCTSQPVSYDVPVNPVPDVLVSIPNQTICSGANSNIVDLTSDVTGTQFTWTTTCAPGIQEPCPSGSSGITIGSSAIFNNVTSPQNVIYSINSTFDGCPGTGATHTVTVNPVANVVLLSNEQTHCSGDLTNIVPLSTGITGATVAYSWNVTCEPGIISCPGTGNGNQIPGTILSLNNTTFVQQTATYTITPAIGSCTGTPEIYKTHINPIPNLTILPVVHGTICSGGSTNFTLSSLVNAAAFNWNATGGAHITPASLSNQTNNPVLLNFSNSGITPEPVTFSITTSAAGCSSLPVDYTVLVNPVADVVLNSNEQIKCSGSPTESVQIGTSVIGATVGYSWTVACDPGIVTCPAGGSANSLPTTTIGLNGSTFVQQTATYTITPSIDGCPGISSLYHTRINPIPDLTIVPALHDAICSNASTNFTLSSQVALPAFQWNASGEPNISPILLNNQTDNPVQRNFSNSGTAIGQVAFSITASAAGCTSQPVDYNVMVNPVPQISCSTAQPVCSGAPTTAVILNTTVAGTEFSWSSTCPVDSINPCPIAPGNGSLIPSMNIFNITNNPQNVTFTINSLFDGCPGTSAAHTITVNPSPTVTNWPLVQTLCSGEASTLVNLTSTVTGTTFSWVATPTGPITGVTGNGNGVIPVQTLLIPPGNSGYVTYHITPSYSGGTSCPGAPTDYKIIVNPLPEPEIFGLNQVCEYQPDLKYYTPNIPGHSYNWTVTGASSVINSNTNEVTVTWGPSSSSPGTLIVTDTIDATGCRQTTAPYTVILQHRPVPTLSGLQSVCDGDTAKEYQTESGMSTYTWSISGGTITYGGGTGNSLAKVTWTTPGNQWIQVNYVNSLGCPGFPAKQLSVTVNPLPNSTIVQDTVPDCEGATHGYLVPNNSQCSYLWSVLPNEIGTITGGQGTNAILIKWLASGVSTMSVKATNNVTSCESSYSQLLEVHPKPFPVFIPCFDTITTPGAKKFTLKGATPYLPNQGVFSGTHVGYNTITGLYEFDPFGANEGTYAVTYTFKNNFGCAASTLPVNIIVKNNPFSCGGELTDVRDGKKYTTNMVGGRCWMTQNLAYGSVVEPSNKPQTDNCANEKYCQPSDAGCQNYGGLYQWDELMKYGSTSYSQGLCPPEWHVPSEAEWQILINNIATGVTPPADGISAGFLKDMALNPGFFSLLKGFYYLNSNWSFTTGLVTATMYWTSASNAQNQALARGINIFNPSVSRYWSSRENAFSVRCLKD